MITKYNYNGNLWTFIWSSIATLGLGIMLLIPLLNNYILEYIIEAETGIKTDYYHRGLSEQTFYYMEAEK